ncbi:hypothetical protein ACHAWF_016859 [Thalassiosira exigua]
MGLFSKLKPAPSSGGGGSGADGIPQAIMFATASNDEASGGGNGGGDGANLRGSDLSASFGSTANSATGAPMTTQQSTQPRSAAESLRRMQAPAKPNPFDDSSSEGDAGAGAASNPLMPGSAPAGPRAPPSSSSGTLQMSNVASNAGLARFEDSVKALEEKLGAIDNTKFMDFCDDDDSDATPLSGIEEDSKESGGFVVLDGSGRNRGGGAGAAGAARRTAGPPERKASGLKKLFGKGKKKGGEKGGRPRDDGGPTDPRMLHRPAIDSEPEESSSDDSSYISGEYDEEFDNSDGVQVAAARPPAPVVSQTSMGNNAAIGVPSASGAIMTPRQLEDELYLYKLETLNLTDACRDLAEQLDECERKLESVQAQATFRIHALEAEMQDGNLGMKNLVRMTSTEMDGRMEALRALGRTAAVQASKLKERDNELILVEQRLRKVRRDVKNLKREGKKNADERTYLKGRLDELERLRSQLEEEAERRKAEAEKAASAIPTAEEKERQERSKERLNDALERVGYLTSQLDGKEGEIAELRERCEGGEGEVLELREELDRKEHDIIRVEQQLEKVRNDLLDAATAARSAEEARVDAEARESDLRTELDETLGALEEVTTKAAIIESREVELTAQLENFQKCKGDEGKLEEMEEGLAELEREVGLLREEREAALDALNDAQAAYADAISDREAQIDSLNKDVEVHREQMELAQAMLEEKEQLASDLRAQLEEAAKDDEMRVAQLEEDLAARTREVGNVSAELEERTNDVSLLEEKLEKARKELMESRADVEAARAESAAVALAAASREEDEESKPTDDEAVASVAAAAANVASAAQISEQMAELAERETQIERLERELGTSRRQLDATRIELEEKDKHADRLKAELERSRAERGARVEELESHLDDKNKNIESLRKDLEDEKRSMNQIVEKLNATHIELGKASEAARSAEEERDRATSQVESSKKAEEAAKHDATKLRSQIELLQKANETSANEVKELRSEADKEKKSSTQAAATLSATNAARQAEMEMKIEKMGKEVEFKKREIDAIKSELKEKDKASSRLKAELKEAKEDFINYKEKVEQEKEKVDQAKEAEALQRVADRDYFDEADEVMSTHSKSDHSFSTAGNNSSRGIGLLGGLFNRSTNDMDLDDNVDWEARSREKDRRIATLEKSLADNSLSINNLKNELVAASSKFKADESQRRLLIQRLENENQAYSLKLEVLESEFDEIRKRKEAVAVGKMYKGNSSFLTDDGSVASSVHSMASGSASSTSSSKTGTSTGMSSMTGVSAITGASRLTPLERDNKKLKKQKKVYETRIASLQTQLSEIQQIVPELMSKSKSQIQKLEGVLETQRQEAEEREIKLKEEVAKLKQQNEQLTSATRSRLQSSDVERQDEIDQLRMRLEAREATIKKLEMLAQTGSMRKKGGKILRKKKKKVPGIDEDASVMSEVSWGTSQQSVSAYSVTNDTVFSAM